MKSDLSSFSFITHVFGVKSKNSLSDPKSQNIFLCFILKSLAFTFRSQIHFGLPILHGAYENFPIWR